MSLSKVEQFMSGQDQNDHWPILHIIVEYQGKRFLFVTVCNL